MAKISLIYSLIRWSKVVTLGTLIFTAGAAQVSWANDSVSFDDPDSKTEGLGLIGINSPDNEDIPGEGSVADATTVEAPMIISPLGAVSDSASKLRGALSQSRASSAQGTTAGTIRVVVYMNLTIQAEGQLSKAARANQRAAIAGSMDTLRQTLTGAVSTVTPYEVVPAAVVTVDASGLEALLASDAVASIRLDEAYPAALDVSTGVIESDLLNAAGVQGDNFEGAPAPSGAYEVAILDSGVRTTHNAFGSRVVDGACYSADGWCPNGGTSQFGVAAGVHCTYSTGTKAGECHHGTHVAGIAAGAFFSGGHEGVARGAKIFSGQVGSRLCSSPNYCWRYYFSDLDLMLARVIAEKNAGRNIVAANMSLGGPLSGVNANCDASFPGTLALFTTMDSLQIAPVVAAGNDSDNNQISYPACLSNAYAISASTDADGVASFSNSSTETDWWAPGSGINAPISTSDTARSNKSGTSMAAPHVTGAFALLRECIANSTDESVAGDLNATGTDITRNGVTRKRINALDAATRNVNNNDFANHETLSGDGPINDYDWNVCADVEPNEPVGGGSQENTVWWKFTPGTTGTFTVSTDDYGSFVTTFDTQLSIFTGTALADLQEIAFDDDDGVGKRSKIVIPLWGGDTYWIRVDGFAGQNGELNLHLERTGEGMPPPKDSFFFIKTLNDKRVIINL